MSRTWGVEIETYGPHDVRTVIGALAVVGIDAREERYNHNDQLINNQPIVDRTWWKIVSDISLRNLRNGMELVGPKLEGENGFTQLRKVCDTLESLGMGGGSPDAGLHVHIYSGDLTVAEAKTIVGRYAKYEEEIDSFMAPSRRNSRCSMAKSIKGAVATRVVNASASTVRDLAREQGPRYFKVNLEAYLKYRTIEYRHHGGSNNFTKISNWIKFLLAFTEASRAIASGSSVPVMSGPGRGPRRGSNNDRIVFMIRAGWTVRQIAETLGKDDAAIIWLVRCINRDFGGEFKVVGKRTNISRKFVIIRELGDAERVEGAVADDSPFEGMSEELKSYFASRKAQLARVFSNVA